jgi:cyclophilin family peptidyl-prolyl cis-trans isomerase
MKKILSLLFVAMFSIFAINVNAQVKKKTAAKKVTEQTSRRPITKRTSRVKDNSIKIKITTDSGVIVVKLYDSTPLHRDNFAKLVKEHFYDSLLFHRVISGFMIQGGDPLSKNAEPGAMLGNGGGDMARIPAEFRPSLFHKKGTLCAARDGNPEMASSACQFYIVQGNILSDDELDRFDMQRSIKYTPEQRMLYKTIGGTPSLDTKYTVFGEVISGLNVIDKIASVQKGQADRPVGDVRMRMEVVK